MGLVHVIYCAAASRERKHIEKKYRSAAGSLDLFETSLAQDVDPPGDEYSSLDLRRDGTPAKIRKCRVVCRELGGKRSGLRVVYEKVRLDARRCSVVMILSVHVHAEGIGEDQLRRNLKSRFIDDPDAALDDAFGWSDIDSDELENFPG